MAKALRIDVVATKNSRQLTELAAEFDKLALEAEAAGKKVNKNFSKSIDDEIKRTQLELLKLQGEFKKTGNLQVAGDIGGLQKNLQALDKIKAKFGSAGKDAGLSLMQGVAYGAAAAAPIVLPAVGAALLGGLGLGVIGAGIIGQLHDPTVKAELQTFKTDASKIFTDATAPFGGVLIRGLEDADATLQKVRPELAAMFKEAAPAADVLFKGLDGFVEKSIPGLHKGLDGAVVVVEELGKDLPGVGKAIGDAFAGVAQGAQGDAHALHDLLTVTDQLIISGGRLSGQSGQLYEQLRSIATLKFDAPSLSAKSLQDTFTAFTTGGIAPLFKAITGIGDKSKDTVYQVVGLNGALDDQANSAADDAAAMQKLNDEVSALLGYQLSAAGATDRFQKDLNDLAGSLDQNNRSLVGNSDAAITNRDAIRSLIEDAERAREAQIKMAGGADASKESIDKANGTYDAAITKIEDVGTKAGLTKKDLDNLAGQYNIEIVTAIAQVNASGLAQNKTPHDVHRAGGGPVTAGVPYIVGEKRPELFVPATNGTIVPNIPSFAAPSYRTFGGSAGSSGPVRATLAVSGGGGTGLGSLISELIRTGQIQLFVDASGAVRSSN